MSTIVNDVETGRRRWNMTAMSTFRLGRAFTARGAARLAFRRLSCTAQCMVIYMATCTTIVHVTRLAGDTVRHGHLPAVQA